jgi:O-antigen/teichoic acid export membrane protein
MQNLTLKQRVLNSSIWTLGANVISQLVRFVSNLIMTRLLAPEMFGLMAIAGVVIAGIHLFSDIGLKQILIQNNRSDKEFVNTIWTMQVFRGLMIWLVSIVISVVFAALDYMHVLAADSVYSDPIFPYVVAAIGFSSVIASFESTKMVLAQRNLVIKLNLMIGLGSQVLGILVMLVWAYFSPTVWALVTGSIIATLSGTLASYIVIPGEGNKFCWDKEVRREVFHFGKWIFLSSILGFLATSSDRLMLGGLVDATLLGYYAIAGLLVGAANQLFQNLIHSIGLPALSETYRKRPYALKSVFYKLRFPFDVALIFLSAFIFSTSNNIVEMLYDDRYREVGWILQILAISLFELRYSLASECYTAIGKPKVNSAMLLVRIAVLYIFGIFVYKFYGFHGVVWVIACSTLATIPLHLYFLHKFSLVDWKREFLVLPILFVGYFTGHLANYLYLNVFSKMSF